MSDGYKCWVYHATKKPRIIDSSEYELACANGWADSPARFLKLSAVGIDQSKIDSGNKDEALKAQQALEALAGVVESINGALNLHKMTKMELEYYAKEHFGVDLDRRKHSDKLIAEIKAMME